MSNIVHIIPHFLPSPNFGGTPIVCNNIAQAQSSAGHDVTVITTDVYDKKSRVRNGFSVEDSYKVYRARNVSNSLAFIYKQSSPIGNLRDIEDILSKADYVHMHEYRSTLNVFSCMKKREKQVFILHPQGTYSNYNNNTTFKKIFDILFSQIINKQIDLYIAISKKERAILINSGIPRNKIMLLYNGIENIVSQDQTPIIKEKYFLYLGRIDSRKGIDILLSVYSKYRKRNSSQNIKLIIAGGDDGYLKSVKEYISRHSLEGDVFIFGPADSEDKINLLKFAQAVFYLSEEEYFGLVPLESLVNGTQVVISDNLGVVEIIKSLDGCSALDRSDERKILSIMESISKLGKRKIDVDEKFLERYSWTNTTRKLIRRMKKTYDIVNRHA